MEPEFVKEVIEVLALQKMNVLHWHLTEDQGWRLPVEAYPKLTEVGAYRTEADDEVTGGAYTRRILKTSWPLRRRGTWRSSLKSKCQATVARRWRLSLAWLHGRHPSCALELGVFKDVYCAGNDQPWPS